MHIVIDIAEENYKEICGYGCKRVDFDIQRMIKNGTVLPKGHGRLIDADATLKRNCEELCLHKPNCEEDCARCNSVSANQMG